MGYFTGMTRSCTCYMSLKRNRYGQHISPANTDHRFNVACVSGYNLQWLDWFCQKYGIVPSELVITKELRATCALGPPSLEMSIEDRMIRALRLGVVPLHMVLKDSDAQDASTEDGSIGSMSS